MSENHAPRVQAPAPEPAMTRAHIISGVGSGDLSVFEAIHALDKASALADKARKDGGVVYTPPAIALRMCRLAAPKLSDRVLEPSCGRGVFIFALAEFHLEQGASPEACARLLAANLRACELDPDAALDAVGLWDAYWASKGVGLPPPIIVKAEDSLFAGFSHERFDLVLGNPPYVRFQNLPEAYRARLQKRFSSCARGNVDLYFAFVERALEQALRFCLIVPNSWMSSRSGAALRSALLPTIEKLVDFGDALVFDPVRAYVCIALASPGAKTEPILVAHAGAALKGAAQALSAGAPKPASAPDAWEGIARADPRLTGSSWLIRKDAPALSPTPKSAPLIAHATLTLGDIATLHSGIATLADSAYSFQADIGADGFARFHDAATGRDLTIHASLCPRRVKITKCSTQTDILALRERILFPYGADGRLLGEAELADSHPDALAFLKARKARLALRDKGKQDDYEGWHAYGRRQGLRTIAPGPWIALPVMSNNRLGHFEVDGAATGRFLFTSGFILVPKPGSTCARVHAALSHPDSWAWILAHGKQWAGGPGDHYMTYGSKLVARLPIPPGPSP